MILGRLSVRFNVDNPLHHLWCNNGTWWVHYTLHFDHRKRRIRRSLRTSAVDEAIRRRDELLARIGRDGEEIPDRRPPPGRTRCPARVADGDDGLRSGRWLPA